MINIRFSNQASETLPKRKRRKEIKDFDTYLPYQEEVEKIIVDRKPMKKLEQKFCSIYQSWVRAGGYKRIETAPWEAKHSRGKDNIPFAEVPEIERNALLACTTEKGYVYKISDMSTGTKGFDGFFFKNSPAYLVFAYTKKFYIISIHNFLHEDKVSKRRSLTEARANEICILSDNYKMN